LLHNWSEFEVMAPETASRYTVMVVDDDPSVLACYRRLLGRDGYNAVLEADPCRVLSDGHTDRRIDLLLLDHKMPGMDGLSLLAELRRRDCHARVILVSAFLNDDVRLRARTLGVDRVLEKPVDVALLRSVIHDLLPLNGARAASSARCSGPDRAGA
jgi:CheY-like chemotaxis protein